MFGVLNREMVKINFTYNDESQMINHTVTRVTKPELQFA